MGKMQTLAALVLSLAPSYGFVSQALSSYSTVQEPEANVKPKIQLWADDEKMLALLDWYLGPEGGVMPPEEPNNQVAIMKSDKLVGQGLLINDIGLVLTVAHVSEDMGTENTHIIDRNGGDYPVVQTDLMDRFHDFAVIFALTDKEPATHYVRWTERDSMLIGEPLTFTQGNSGYASYNVNFESRPGTILEKGEKHKGYEQCDRWLAFQQRPAEDGLEWRVLQESKARQAESVRISSHVIRGYSGSGAFSSQKENARFFGLVWGYEFDNTLGLEEGGLGLVTSAEVIRQGIGSYLAKHGVPTVDESVTSSIVTTTKE